MDTPLTQEMKVESTQKSSTNKKDAESIPSKTPTKVYDVKSFPAGVPQSHLDQLQRQIILTVRAFHDKKQRFPLNFPMVNHLDIPTFTQKFAAFVPDDGTYFSYSAC